MDFDFIRLAEKPFSQCASISIDYAVMEHTDKATVVPADMGWNDVGSWTGLWDDGVFHPNTAIGFGGGDVAPFLPGSRFKVFDH